MDTWARATQADRSALFNQTASVKGISPEIIEKDFWVCWMLRQVFQLQGFPRIIFKGGTSLSKAFGIIRRFSEDIDLVINRHELGFTNENDPANQERAKLRDRTVEKLKESCVALIRDAFLPTLNKQIQSVIGDNGWVLLPDRDAPEADTLEFTYPVGISGPMVTGYVKRVVRLELGCRGDQVPSEEAMVTPYASEAFPHQFAISNARVNALSPERTFWEKVTMLHREYHRVEAGKPASERIFRHYHDVVVIARHERGRTSLKDPSLLEQVVSHKQHFFREAGAHYELAKKGSLRLVPGPRLEEELRRDHAKMREMFFDEHPDFDEVMGEISNLERALNEG